MTSTVISKVIFGIFILNILLHETLAEEKERDEKFLSMFNIVRFPNDACDAGDKNGTCYTKEECSDKGGTNDGTCASGYGICCTFEVTCGSTTSENNTYFTSSGTSGTLGECRVKFCRAADNICQLRLDFDSFAITGPQTGSAATLGYQPPTSDIAGCGTNGQITNGAANGAIDDCTSGGGSGTAALYPYTQCLTDSFSVTNPGGISPPTICGKNQGRHMYVDASADCNDLVFYLGASDASYNIRITQYNCEYENRAPQGCTEYLFGESTGFVYTYNWDSGNGYHLANQEQNICIRREKDNCKICYSTVQNEDFGVSAGGGRYNSMTNGLSQAFTSSNVAYFRNQGCCGYGSKGNSVRSENTADGGGPNGPSTGYLNFQLPRRDCVIIPGLYYSAPNSRMVQFSDICGNAGLGGFGTLAGSPAFTGNWRTGKFASGGTTDDKTLCTTAQPFTVRFSSDNFEGIYEQATSASTSPSDYRGDKGFKLYYSMTSGSSGDNC